jgi:hypothetical protein
MQRLRIPRRRGQDLPINVFGLRQPTGLVKLDGYGKGIRNRCHIWSAHHPQL